MTDEELLEAWKAGDEGSCAELVHRCAPRLLAFINRMVGDVHRAEELTQEVFLKMVTHGQAFEPRGAKFSTWLFQIAKHLTLNELRSRQTRREQPLDESRGASVPHAKDARVDLALSSLTEEQRCVFALKHDQDFSYEEIGETLGIPVGTVKSRMHTAVKILREAWEGKER